jgi:plasmid maintenance system antidote protein VapI
VRARRGAELQPDRVSDDDRIEPIHPGEILLGDFIEGFGITADTAIRLARYFGTSEEFWMDLQSNYELLLERRALHDKVAAITPLQVA